MALAIPIVMMAGAAVSAYGAVQQANAAQQAAQYNAKIQQRNAEIALDQSNADALKVQKQGMDVLGAARANYGASGVTGEGSPLDVLEYSASQAKMDENTVRYKGQLKALGYGENATLDNMAGETAVKQGQLNSASALLTGVGRAGSTYAAGNRRFRSDEA